MDNNDTFNNDNTQQGFGQQPPKDNSQQRYGQQPYNENSQQYYGGQYNENGQQYYGGQYNGNGQPFYGNQEHQYGQPVPEQKSKVTAGVLGILLGAFGIHKFYLGYTKAGVIMLLVSILSLGFAATVMEVIGLIEGILYLTKSDEEFYYTYVQNKKEWF